MSLFICPRNSILNPQPTTIPPFFRGLPAFCPLMNAMETNQNLNQNQIQNPPLLEKLHLHDQEKEGEEKQENEKLMNKSSTGTFVEEIEEITGYKFNDPSLLQEAFTDPSYKESCLSYERLEYIGDSVLNLLIAKEHYFVYPDLSPGKLTRLRATNVDTEKLARVALKCNLHKFLRHKKPLLSGQVRKTNFLFILLYSLYLSGSRS